MKQTNQLNTMLAPPPINFTVDVAFAKNEQFLVWVQHERLQLVKIHPSFLGIVENIDQFPSYPYIIRLPGNVFLVKTKTKLMNIRSIKITDPIYQELVDELNRIIDADVDESKNLKWRNN